VGLLLLNGAPPPPVPPPVVLSAYAAQMAKVDRAALILFGEPIVYQPQVGLPVPVTGIYDEMGAVALGGAPAGVEVLDPTVFLLLADLPVDPELDEPTLLIRGRTYRPTERRPDGIGGIVLELRLVVA